MLRLSQPCALNVLWELGDQALGIPALEHHLQPRPVFSFFTEPGTNLELVDDADASVLTGGDEITRDYPSLACRGPVERSAAALTAVAPLDGSSRLAMFWGALHNRPSRHTDPQV